MIGSDLRYARLCAASYDPAPAGTIYDHGEFRAIVTDGVCTVRGTVPTDWDDWRADFAIWASTCRTHPALGPIPAGALAVAEIFDAAIPPDVATFCGHSLGGQVAMILAAMRRAACISFDAPKPGTATLRQACGALDWRLYRFFDSYVTDWPTIFGGWCQPRPPVCIGDAAPDPIAAHSIGRMVAWMEARQVPA